MVIWQISTAVLAVVVGFLLLKLGGMKKSLKQITVSLRDILCADTNAQITVASTDPAIRSLAAELNGQLQSLRREWLQLQNGNHELQSAVTNISHDLRTPLTAINGYLELMKDDPAEAERYLAIIRERAESLTAMTEELFRFTVITATSDELHPEQLSLNSILAESIAGFYAALTERGITPIIELPESPVYRELDRSALRRIFDNLLSNTIKYSDGDLAITLTEHGVTRFSNHAASLDAVSAQKLFDRFYTVETGRNATGLGLSIAKLLTERMGGSVSARYENGVLSIEISF